MPIISKRDIADLRTDLAKFAAYVRIVVAEWRTVSIFLLLGLLGAMIYLHRTPVAYTAKMVLVATQAQNQINSSAVGQLASFMNLAPANQPLTPFTLYPDAVTSEVVADKLVKEHPDSLRRLFSWDERTHTWRRPGRLHAISDFIKPILGIPVIPWQAPNAEQLREVIQGRVFIRIDTRRPLITLSFDSADPDFAKTFLNQVNAATDGVIKQMTLDRSSKYAQYLENKLATVQANDLRQVLISSYTQQVTQVMLSSSDAPFAAQPLGDATVSLTPTRPRVREALLIGVLLGTAAGIADALMQLRLLQYLAQILSSVGSAILSRERKFIRPEAFPPN